MAGVLGSGKTGAGVFQGVLAAGLAAVWWPVEGAWQGRGPRGGGVGMQMFRCEGGQAGEKGRAVRQAGGLAVMKMINCSLMPPLVPFHDGPRIHPLKHRRALHPLLPSATSLPALMTYPGPPQHS